MISGSIEHRKDMYMYYEQRKLGIERKQGTVNIQLSTGRARYFFSSCQSFGVMLSCNWDR